MKICFVTYDINLVGGIERVIALLSHQFTEEYHWDLDIISLYSDEFHPFFDVSSQATIIHGKAHEDYKAGVKFLKQYLREHRDTYDCIFTFHLYLAGPMALIIRTLSRDTHWIATEHNSVFYYKLKRKLLNLIMYRPASSLVLLTDQCKHWYQKFGYRHTITIPNAVSFELKEQSKLTENTILAIGRVEYIKGFDMLIDAFAMLAPKYPDWKLRILGDGTALESLREQVRTLGLEQQIELPGYTNQVQDHLLNASFLCMTTRSGFEGFPMTALESLECGVPVVAYDMYQLREMAGTSSCMLFSKNQDVSDLAECMQKLMDDPQLLETMGHNAKERASYYHMDHIGSMWKEHLEQFCRNRKD